ncbi:hypothetical protein WPS_32790 [Vulcanimicrobium alpinum]|uniref:TonB C-terminal domain-containing protein n=1 Tax=Vulcanimicrobium alpinum TaxID=3016050 RepID=A0AAN1Y0E7_UNVUL|nr:hypothetical protein [Vulcanimicrobium alpinum]BDE08003.1 hypothetical protein WPS_32790 [Vulcanimicrobium alpinum]
MRFPLPALVAVLAAGSIASAATPPPKAAPNAPKGSAAQRINVEKLQPRAIFPKVPLHTEVVVEINKLGQVARVRSIKPSHDRGFDARMYGNALQAFIRTPDGKVVLGTYRLTYDYDPKSLRIRRDVALIKAGGVNPNATGAATDMMEIARRNGKRAAPVGPVTPAPNPAPSVNVKRMPDLPQVMQTPH